MSETMLFRHQCIDERGLVSGALYHFRNGRAPGAVYTDPAMRVPGKNPMKANARGVVVAYLPLNAEYEVTVTRPDGSFLEQFTSTSIPMLTVTEHENGMTSAVQTVEANEPAARIDTSAQSAEPEVVYVDREVIKEVEKIVYRDSPETLARLEGLQKAAEEARAKLQEKQTQEEPTPARDIAALIQQERRDDETDADTLERLRQEFGYLEGKLGGNEASAAQKQRHTYLSENKRELLP